MAFSLTWLPSVLMQAGLKVAKVDGWELRGRGEIGPIKGVICHYTGGPKSGNMPSLKTLINGRPDLPGPLSQLGLGRDGTYYVIAAGRCNHAGPGKWQGITTGNTNFIGIEAEHSGRSDDPWTEVQMQAYHHGVAAILRHVGRGAEFCAGHKEYALPPGRKDDPDFDMHLFRVAVQAILANTDSKLAQIPASDPSGRPTLRRGSKGDAVLALQKRLGMNADGDFGPKTEAAVRAFQLSKGMVPDGIVGPKTWKALDG